MQYSKKTGGFYPESVDYPNLPDDLVTIDDKDYCNLLGNTDENLEITADDNGYPMLSERRISIVHARQSMSLSAAQARINLSKAGLLLRILETINVMPDDAPLKIKWEYETVLHRLDPVLNDFCKSSLGLTDEQIDDLFTWN